MAIAVGATALLVSLAWLAGIACLLKFFRPPAVAAQGGG
jgi:hypothetical protein